MNKFVAVIIVLLLVAAGFLFYKNRTKAPINGEINTGSAENASMDLNSTSTPAQTATSTEARVKEFTVEAGSFYFSPKALSVNLGDTVRLTVVNKGGIHNLKIDEFNATTKTLQAGESDTITFTADKKGSFQYYCSIGTHRQMGMWGTLTVK